MTKKDLMQGFDDMRALEDDWDTYGAKAPSYGVIGTAETIVLLVSKGMKRSMEELFDIMPGLDGEVELYFKCEYCPSKVITVREADEYDS
jgi:hypothetical protein